MTLALKKSLHVAIACAAATATLLLAGCSPSSPADSTAPAASIAQANAPEGTGSGLELPKVPFGNQPCQSLSQAEQKQIEMQAQGYADPVPGKPDRAPAGLPYDNLCRYGDFTVGYMAQVDYDSNSAADNRSTEHAAPTGLPDAFYARRDAGLWFRKNGYYVNVEGRHRLQEPVARVVAAKL